MAPKFQYTSLHRNFGLAFGRLELWAENPWRRYSLYLILMLTGFLIGSSIGVINGVLALMDPVGAFVIVLIIEIMVRLRRNKYFRARANLFLKLMDTIRIGLLYGLLLEGFKLF